MTPPIHGYSGKPLSAKLGLKPGLAAVAINAPAPYDALTAGAEIARLDAGDPLAGPYDLIHLFAPDQAALAAALPRMLAALVERGALWVSWPKKSSPLFIDITEDAIRAAAFPLGLVDVKVCAVDADWSALKLVRRRV